MKKVLFICFVIFIFSACALENKYAGTYVVTIKSSGYDDNTKIWGVSGNQFLGTLEIGTSGESDYIASVISATVSDSGALESISGLNKFFVGTTQNQSGSFSGKIDANFTFSGSWSVNGIAGTFSGKKQ